MWSIPHRWASTAAVVLTLAGCMALGAFVGGAGPVREDPEATRATQTPDSPEVRDTPANLQVAFTNEMNAKEWYAAASRRAELDRYPAVARLFRACSRAEQVHADRHVEAIAWTGGEAKALLARVALGTTEENLREAIQRETYEVDSLYPAMLALARAERKTMAVRSLTFALSAEREHARLLQAALDALAPSMALHPVYVCPMCGKTVETLSFPKCPNCFTGKSRFLSVT